MRSCRVGTNIFATVRVPYRVRIMVDGLRVLPAVADHPVICESVVWGRRPVSMGVRTQQASPQVPRELSWACRSRQGS